MGHLRVAWLYFVSVFFTGAAVLDSVVFAGAGVSVFLLSPAPSTAFVSSFFATLFAPPLMLSVLYHPLPLNAIAGTLINFSVFLDAHPGHGGFTFEPNGRLNSKVVLHF